MAMKRFILLLIPVILLGFAACKKKTTDDPPPVDNTNTFTVKSVAYPIVKGALIYFQVKNNVYQLETFMCSNGVVIDTTGISGIGHGLMVHFISTDTLLAPGTYTYATSGAPMTWNEGIYFCNVDFVRQTGTIGAILNGSITVTRNLTNYVFTFNTTADVGPLTGNYTGKLEYYYGENKLKHPFGL